MIDGWWLWEVKCKKQGREQVLEYNHIFIKTKYTLLYIWYATPPTYTYTQPNLTEVAPAYTVPKL